MKEFFARLNSTERRFVIVVLVVVFLVINVLFVWPRFSDWNALGLRMDKANTTIDSRDKMMAQSKSLESKIKELEKEGKPVPPEDQVNQFLSTINSQAAESGVNIISSVSVRGNATTNQFFNEQVQSLNVQSDEPKLVDFLFRLGSGDSMIRVRDMSLNPDPPHYNLQANIKLVASYQKKIQIRTAVTNAPAAKTAGSPSPSTTPPPVKTPPAPGPANPPKK